MSLFRFDPMTRVRLEVERDPAPGEYVNLIPNSTGELGMWGWVSPTPGSSMRRYDYDAGVPTIQYTTVGGQINIFYTTPFKVTPGQQVRGQWTLRDAPVGGFRATFLWFDINGVLIDSAGNNISIPSTNYWTSARTVPAGVYFAALQFEVTKADFSHPYPANGSNFAVANVRVFSSAMGALTDAAMLANAGAPATLWTNLLGPTHDIQVTRTEFDLGTLSATILDATLDPAVASTIRAGRKVRLTALSGATSGTFVPLFTGNILDADVSYDVPDRRVSDPKHARIRISAVDAMQTLSAAKRTKSVDTVAELPWVLEGDYWTAGLAVPWDCDGDTGHRASATVRATNDNATAADQVVLTRDGVLGYAWIDRRGVLTVRTTLPSSGSVTLDENVYSAIDLGWDTSRIINSLDARVFVYSSGETSEATTVTRLAPDSIAKWGRHHRQFTMTLSALAAWLVPGGDYDMTNFAAAVFAGNAEPQIMPTSVTVPILTDTDRASRAFTDLYDLRRVVNTGKGIDKSLRVTSVTHRITPEKWLMELGFARDSTVAMPQLQPALAKAST